MAGLSSITNIVVLMFENRSFDNIFGNLYVNGSTVNGYSFEGVTAGTEPNDSKPWTDVQPVLWNDEMITTPNPDPGEIFQDVNMQLFGSTQDGPPWPSASSLGTPPMNGFVNNYTLQSDPNGPLSSEVPRKRSWGPPARRHQSRFPGCPPSPAVYRVRQLHSSCAGLIHLPRPTSRFPVLRF